MHLKYHINRKHREASNSFKCGQCPFVTTSQSKWKNHLSVHHAPVSLEGMEIDVLPKEAGQEKELARPYGTLLMVRSEANASQPQRMNTVHHEREEHILSTESLCNYSQLGPEDIVVSHRDIVVQDVLYEGNIVKVYLSNRDGAQADFLVEEEKTISTLKMEEFCPPTLETQT